MINFFKDEEANKFFQDFVHENFAKKSGLMKHEYMLHFDPELQWHETNVDFVITCGKILHIALRCYPTSHNLGELLKSCFSQDLKRMLRSYALVRKEDAERWYGLAIKLGDEEINMKKVRMNSFSREMITAIKLIDRKTKKTVIVDIINGDAFTAQDKALKLLYGERLL